MSRFTLHNLTIASFHEGLLQKEFSALEVTQAYFSHIARTDKEIGAYLSIAEPQALRAAEETDLALARGEEINPLAGVPLAVKDNILIEGLPATAGSKILEAYTASYDAHVIARLKSCGAVFLGKTNMDEFAFGSSTENSAFGATKNPHDIERVPGGSSGGSAAAVSGHMALAALGSETGGSIRQPAAFCGVVGLKTTYGAVSRSGLIAMASSLDQIGPIARTVEDTATLFLAIAGHDPMDATSARHDYAQERESIFNASLENIREMRVGIPKEYFESGLDENVARSVEEAIRMIKSLKIECKEISLPHTRYALPCYYIVMPAEVSSNLARFDGMRYSRDPKTETAKTAESALIAARGKGFGAEAKRRIMLGTFVLSSGYHEAYYKKAQAVRSLIAQDFENAFGDVDVILTPTTPTPAFRIGEKTEDPVQMYLSDIFTTPANIAGVPAISIPAPKTGALPTGFQLIGNHFREADIFALGLFYERITRPTE